MVHQFVHAISARLSLRNIRIRSRIVLIYSTLIIMSVTLICTFSIVIFRQSITIKSVNYTAGILEQMGENMDISLQQIDRDTYMIFSNQEVLSTLKYSNSPKDHNKYMNDAYVDSILTDVLFTNPNISSIFLFGLKGDRYGTTYTYPYTPYTKLAKDSKLGDGKLVWLDTDTKNGIIPAVRMVINSQMEPIGTLLVNVRTSSITSIISNQLSSINGSVFILNQKGNIVTSINHNFFENELTSNVLRKIEQEMTPNRVGGGYLTENIAGQSCVVTYYPSNFNDWKYISIIPIKALTNDVAKLQNFLLVVGLLITCIFVMISFFVSNGITKPIKQIANAMKKMEIQNKKNEVIYKGQDEIAFLSESFNDMVLRIDTLIKENYEQKLRQNEQELRTLQAQINPHFLYNTLDIVNWLAYSKGVTEIGEIIRSLSSILRYSISNENETVPLEEEIKHVQNYCNIQTLRFPDKLQVEYEIDEDIYGVSIPKLVLQPIVENTILHGCRGKEGMGIVRIRGHVYDDKVCIEVSDNGVGIPPDKLERILSDQDRKRSGIGIVNVNQRLKIKYGKEYGVEINSTVNLGTSVRIWLPY